MSAEPDVPHIPPAEQLPEPHPPRYANATLFDDDTGSVIRHDYPDFIAGQIVRLRLDIGPLSADSMVARPSPFPDRQLPDDIDIDLDVMVSSTDLGVVRDGFAPGAAPAQIAHGRFVLPRDGSAAHTPDGATDLNFRLQLPPGRRHWYAGVWHARIGYYYRNMLVQSQLLTIRPGAVPRVWIVTDFTTSDDLTGLSKLPRHPRLSILTNANDDGSHQIVLRRPGGGAEPALGRTFTLNAGNVAATIRRLRAQLSMFAPVQKLRSRSQLIDDLRRLAPIGWELYEQLPGQRSADIFNDLLDHPDSAVIQVTRPTSSGFVFPWSYIYEIPLQSGVKPALCPLVEDWDGAVPLFEGAPRQCPHGPHDGDVLCPFGFWGFRYAIEQLSSSDRAVETIVLRPGSGIVVGEARYDIPLATLDAHVARLRQQLGGLVQVREGRDAASIERMLGDDLPFVYFYCHGERLNIADPNTCLGVGNREKITAGDVIGWTRRWMRRLKRLIWNEVRPLVFINACHGLAVEPETMVSFVQAFVGAGRAAGVIGTEVKVEQGMAMEVAESFISAWFGGSSVEEALRAIRLDYLRSGNMFGLVYTPYCWSELRIERQAAPAAAGPAGSG